jgi:hypothetical protein
MLLAGIEASRATTNYPRQNSKEIARLTSNTARIFGQNTKDTVGRMQEGRCGYIPTRAASTTSKTTGTTEDKETGAFRRK